MNRKAGVLTLPSGRKLRIAELLVAQDESVSSEFNGAEVQSGKRHGEYNRALMAASIIEVDGKRIDASTFDPRKVLI
ncbi:MAG TPA: hypothetical protein VK181_20485, partial [Rhizobium sp.]|nr:hypothetical protein [Rhizobium sp.]